MCMHACLMHVCVCPEAEPYSKFSCCIYVNSDVPPISNAFCVDTAQGRLPLPVHVLAQFEMRAALAGCPAMSNGWISTSVFYVPTCAACRVPSNSSEAEALLL